MGSGGDGFVATHCLAAVKVRVHTRVELVHHVALMGSRGIWCGASIGAVGAVSAMSVVNTMAGCASRARGGPVWSTMVMCAVPGFTSGAGSVRSCGAGRVRGAGCAVVTVGVKTRIELVQRGSIVGTMVTRSVSGAGCTSCSMGAMGTVGGSAVGTTGIEAGPVFSSLSTGCSSSIGASCTGSVSSSASTSMGTGMSTVGAMSGSAVGTTSIEAGPVFSSLSASGASSISASGTGSISSSASTSMGTGVGAVGAAMVEV